MAASLLTRALGALELLALNSRGLGLQVIADSVDMPKSGAHRLLGELMQQGFVIQDADNGQYKLTGKLSSLGMQHLAGSGIINAVQPLLDPLAQTSGELVRLAVVDRSRLIFIAKAQGAQSGLRYDPDSGGEAPLFCTATAFAWLAGFSDDEAIRLVASRGPINLENRGPASPSSFAEILHQLSQTRTRGFGQAIDMSAPGMSAIAASVREPGTGQTVAVLSIGGPSARLTEQKMTEFAPLLLQAADELSQLAVLTRYLHILT
jgi:DNA-binding IclR family transcriptional regulator